MCEVKEKKLFDDGCPCNTCKFSKGPRQGCMTSVFTGCDVLFNWFYPGKIKNPKYPGER